MKIKIYDIEGLGKIPLEISSDHDGELHHIIDFINKPALLGDNLKITFVLYPYAGSYLYLPTLSKINQINSTLVGYRDNYRDGYIETIKIGIEESVEYVNYLVSLQNEMIEKGLYVPEVNIPGWNRNDIQYIYSNVVEQELINYIEISKDFKEVEDYGIIRTPKKSKQNKERQNIDIKEEARKLALPLAQNMAQKLAEELAKPIAEELAKPMAKELAERIAVPLVEERALELANIKAAELAKPIAEEMAKPLAEKMAGELAKPMAEEMAKQLAKPMAEELAKEMLANTSKEDNNTPTENTEDLSFKEELLKEAYTDDKYLNDEYIEDENPVKTEEEIEGQQEYSTDTDINTEEKHTYDTGDDNTTGVVGKILGFGTTEHRESNKVVTFEYYKEEQRIPSNIDSITYEGIANKLKENGLDCGEILTINERGILPSIHKDYMIINPENENTVKEMIEKIQKQVISEIDSERFLPMIYRYHDGVHITLPSDAEEGNRLGTVTLGLNTEKASELIEAILLSKDMNSLEFTNKTAYLFAKEIERRLCRGNIGVKDFLSTWEGGASLNFDTELILGLLKYYVAVESPNGLYDNLFLLLYLIKVELTLRGIEKEDIEETLGHLFLAWSLNERALVMEEDEGNSKGDDDYDVDPSKENAYYINPTDMIIARGQTSFRSLLYASTRESEAKFELPRKTGTSLTETLCISSVYDIGLKVKSPLIKFIKIDGWVVKFSEYGVKSTVLGAEVSSLVIIHTLGEMQSILDEHKNNLKLILGGSRNSNKGENESRLPDNITRQLMKYDYNSQLSKLKQDKDLYNELSYFKPILYFKDFNMSLSNYVITKFEGKKVICLGAVVKVNNINDFFRTDSAENRYHYLPITGSYLMTLFKSGVRIEGMLENPEDVRVISSVELDNKYNEGFYAIKLNKGIASNREKIIQLRNLDLEEINPENVARLLTRITPDRANGTSLNKVKPLPIADVESEVIVKLYESVINK